MVHHEIRKTEKNFGETISMKKMMGKRVLSHHGKVIGSISQIRLHPRILKVEGIIVRQGIFKRPLYIGHSYISKFSEESIVLNIEPSVLVKNRQVITHDGESIGRVKQVVRKGLTNDVKELIVKGNLLHKRISIPIDSIASIGNSVMLKANYNVKKKYLWQKS